MALFERRETWLVVGLGNPGTAYAHTRHNVGFEVTNILSARWHAGLTKSKHSAVFADARVGERRVLLAQPQTYMNESGIAVGALMRWYKIAPEHLMVIYDDIDLPTGKTRMRLSGGSGTHNGMRSVVPAVGSEAFARVRVGIGSRPPEIDLKDWVLSRPMTKEEQDVMQAAFVRAADAVELWLRGDSNAAMRACNG